MKLNQVGIHVYNLKRIKKREKNNRHVKRITKACQLKWECAKMQEENGGEQAGPPRQILRVRLLGS